MKYSTFLTIAASLLVLAASAGAAAVPIVNAGFENPVLANPDDWTWFEVPGWTQVGGEGFGAWRVTLSDFDPVVAPEGQNVVYTENPASGVANGLKQVLTTNFAADMDYTLTVKVGNSWAYYWSGYSVQLLAGGTVIKEDNNTWVPPDYMLWGTSTVEYTYDAAHAGLVGQPLEIRLLNLGIDVDGRPGETVGVEFDAIALDAIPEPATMTMLALMGLGFCARRRKR